MAGAGAATVMITAYSPRTGAGDGAILTSAGAILIMDMITPGRAIATTALQAITTTITTTIITIIPAALSPHRFNKLWLRTAITKGRLMASWDPRRRPRLAPTSVIIDCLLRALLTRAS